MFDALEEKRLKQFENILSRLVGQKDKTNRSKVQFLKHFSNKIYLDIYIYIEMFDNT